MRAAVVSSASAFLCRRFIPAQNKNPKAPVLLWLQVRSGQNLDASECVLSLFLFLFLQGGPGGSSLFGMFVEHGPWTVNNDMTLAVNPNTWSNQYSMLYIDNPVGKLRSMLGQCFSAAWRECGGGWFAGLALGSRCRRDARWAVRRTRLLSQSCCSLAGTGYSFTGSDAGYSQNENDVANNLYE